MSGDVVAVAIPHVTVSISQPSRAYFKLKMGSTDFTSPLSPAKDEDALSTTHSWSLLTLTLKESLSKAEKTTFRVEVWQKWSWPWNDTLAGECELEFSKLLKNHCTLPVSDPRRASQAVTIPLQSANPELKCFVHAFPETASPLHWRQLFEHHATKLTAMKDLVFLFERGKAKESAKDDKWSFYCDNETLAILVGLLRQWSLGTLPNANKNENKREKLLQPSNLVDLTNSGSSSESSSDEEEVDRSPHNNDVFDEALSPWVPETKSSNILANLTAKIWKMIIPLDSLRSKLGSLGLPLMILEILPDAFELHPRHAMFLMEIIYPYMSATNAVTMNLIIPYCIRLSEFTQSYISTIMTRLNDAGPSPSIASNSSGDHSSTATATESSENSSTEDDSLAGTPSSSSSLSNSSTAVELMSISRDEDNEISSLDLMAPVGTFKSPPRKSKPKSPIASVSNISEKRRSKLIRRETKAQLKAERNRIFELSIRERSRMRLVTVLFQYLKYLDPKYIPIILKSPAIDAINTVLSFPEVPTTLIDLCVDALKFIGPKYAEILDERRCFENLWLLTQQTKDMHLKFKVVDTMRQFKTTDELKNEKDALSMFIEIISSSTMIKGAEDGSTRATVDPKMATIVYKFLRFLADSTEATKQEAFQYASSIHLMLDYILGSQQSRIMAVQLLPTNLPAGLLLEAQFPAKLVTWLKDSTIPWSESGPTMLGLLKTLFSAKIFAPQYPWSLEDAGEQVPLDEKGNPPKTWVKWSELDAWLSDRKLDLLGEIYKKVSSSGSFDSLALFNTMEETMAAFFNAKRPLLDHLVLKKGLFAEIHQNLWKSGRQASRFLEVIVKILPDYCRMMITTYRLGMWQISGYQLCFPEMNGIREKQSPLVSFSSSFSKMTISSTQIIDFFRVLTLVFDNMPDRISRLLESAEVWDALALLASLAMLAEPSSPGVILIFFNKVSANSSKYAKNFYRLLLRPILTCIASTSPISAIITSFVYLEAINKGIAQAEAKWTMVDESSSIWLQHDLMGPLHPQFGEYVQFFENFEVNAPIKLETDGNPLWLNYSPLSPHPAYIPLPLKKFNSKAKSRAPVPAKTGFWLMPKVVDLETKTTPLFGPQLAPEPEYWDQKFALNAPEAQKMKTAPELPDYPVPLNGVVQLSNSILSLMSTWFATSNSPFRKYGDTNLNTVFPIIRFLLATDPLFETRWFTHKLFWRNLSAGDLPDASARQLGEIILDQLRSPVLISNVLTNPSCVPLVSHCIKRLMEIDFAKVPLAEFYALMKMWLLDDRCRRAVPSPVMEFFVAHTTQKIPHSPIQTAFCELWMSLMEPLVSSLTLTGSLSVLSRLSNASGVEVQSRINDIWFAKLEAELDEARKTHRAVSFDPSPIYTNTSGTQQQKFTSATFKTWTMLWRAGTVPIANIGAAFDPFHRSTYPLKEKIGDEAYEKFTSKNDAKIRASESWMFIKDKELRPTASSQAPKQPLESISAATTAITSRQNEDDERCEFGSVENDFLVQEHRERVFRQAEFVGTVCHESLPRGQHFYPSGAFGNAVDPSNWSSRDPLPKLVACAFRHWEARTPEGVSVLRMCKRYATLLVADVTQKVDFFRAQFPIVILAILQTGVLNSHSQYEHRLYPALYRIFEDRLCERHRAWRVMKDMVACAGRHPAAFSEAVPVWEIFKTAMALNHDALTSSAWRLLGAVATQPKMLSFLRQNRDFLGRLMAAASASTTTRPHTTAQFVALQLLPHFQDHTLAWISFPSLFEGFVPSLASPNELTHSCASLVHSWIQQKDLFDQLIQPQVLLQMRNRIEMIPRHLEILFPSIIRNVPSSLDSFLEIASGRDENGEINNGSVIGRYLIMLSGFKMHEEEALASSIILGSSRLHLGGPTDLLSRAVQSSSNWQSFHKFSGLIDLSVALFRLSGSARELLGISTWNAIIEQWAAGIKESGKHHPIFDFVSRKFGLSSRQYSFKSSEVEFSVPINPTPLSSFGGDVISAPMNTFYACVHDRPVHVVIDQPLSLGLMKQAGRSEFRLCAVPGSNIQIPASMFLGFATAAAIEKLKAQPDRCVGQVEGSYAVSSDLASIHCNGNTIHTINAQTTSRRMDFILTLNIEYQTITVAFNEKASATKEQYTIWSVDLSEDLFPVLSFKSSACYILDHSWGETMSVLDDELFSTQKPEPKAPTLLLQDDSGLILPSAPRAPPPPPQQHVNDDMARIRRMIEEALNTNEEILELDHHLMLGG
jgi:hypothetical protein